MNSPKLKKSLIQAIAKNDTTLLAQLFESSSSSPEEFCAINLNKLSQTSFHVACINDKVDVLNYLWQLSGYDRRLLMTKDSCYKGPLHHASQHGSFACVHWLLTHVEDIELDSSKKAGWTPLMLAVVRGSPERAEAIVNALIERGANPSLKNKDGWTALHIACKGMTLGVVERLACAEPLSCTWRSNNGRSPLHTASFAGNIAIVKFLVNHFYENVDLVDDCGITPLMDALVSGHEDVAAWLLDEACASVDHHDRLGRHTVHVVCDSGPLLALTFLVNRWPALVHVRTLDGNSTPLLSAARAKKANMVDFLLQQGADIAASDNSGRCFRSFM